MRYLSVRIHEEGHRVASGRGNSANAVCALRSHPMEDMMKAYGPTRPGFQSANRTADNCHKDGDRSGTAAGDRADPLEWYET